MKRLFSFILIFFISLSTISALCEDGQIDINTASAEELDELYLVGEVKAQAIIDARPFSSIDELLDIYGIGEKTVEGIKEQGLACVDEESEKIAPLPKGMTSESGGLGVPPIAEYGGKEIVEEKEEIEKKDDEKTGMINLTAKTIKSQDNKENQSNNAMYWFVGFCVLLGILFILKKKKYQNEFG